MREIVLADFVLGCSGLRVQACAVPQANFKPDQRCRNDTSKSKILREDMVKVKVFATRNQLIAALGQIGQGYQELSRKSEKNKSFKT